MNGPLWKVVHIAIPRPNPCPVENGYAVAYTLPFVKFPGTDNETHCLLIPLMYSGYMISKHAIANSNSLNMTGIDRLNPMLNSCTDLILVNADYVCNGV